MTAGGRRRDVHFSGARRLALEGDNTTTTTMAAAPPPRPRPFIPNSPGPHGGSYFSRSFNSNVVVVMAVLLFALVVAAFINTMARCILRRRRPQPPEDHNSTDKGLDKSIIESLPVVAYGAESVKSLFDPAGGNECVICLSEFVTGEKVRLLPDCQHGFHLCCIDTWLMTHTTCPVCRRSVLPTEPCSETDTIDPSCAHHPSVIGGSSARLGSSRFGSSRIASVDIEIEPSGTGSSNATPTTFTAPASIDATSSSSSSSSRPNRPFAALFSAETMASIIHGAGSRRQSSPV